MVARNKYVMKDINFTPNFRTDVYNKWAAMSENAPSDMHPAKIQISLCIHAFWSESSLGTFWIAKDAKFFHVDNKDC